MLTSLLQNKELSFHLNNVFLADIDPYFGELIRKLFCSKYDVASSEGNRTEHRPLPTTGLDSTDCVCRRVRQWVMTVMARSFRTKS